MKNRFDRRATIARRLAALLGAAVIVFCFSRSSESQEKDLEAKIETCLSGLHIPLDGMAAKGIDLASSDEKKQVFVVAMQMLLTMPQYTERRGIAGEARGGTIMANVLFRSPESGAKTSTYWFADDEINEDLDIDRKMLKGQIVLRSWSGSPEKIGGKNRKRTYPFIKLNVYSYFRDSDDEIIMIGDNTNTGYFAAYRNDAWGQFSQLSPCDQPNFVAVLRKSGDKWKPWGLFRRNGAVDFRATCRLLYTNRRKKPVFKLDHLKICSPQ